MCGNETTQKSLREVFSKDPIRNLTRRTLVKAMQERKGGGKGTGPVN